MHTLTTEKEELPVIAEERGKGEANKDQGGAQKCCRQNTETQDIM